MNWKRVKMYWEMDAPKELQKEMARKILIFFLIEIGIIILSCLYIRLKLSWGDFQYHLLEKEERIQMLKQDVWNGFNIVTTIPQLTFVVGILLIWILPFYGVYRHYYGSNSIYTLMRLPGSKKEFYFGKLIPTMIVSILLYGLCGVMYLIPCGLYNILIPDLYQFNVSRIHIEEYVSMLPVFVYVPSMLILAIFAERSKKRPLYTILAIGIITLSLWISTPFWGSIFTKGIVGIVDLIVIFVATILCMISSVYYIEKVQLV